MNINSAYNPNQTNFCARFKITKTKTFNEPSRYFGESIENNLEKWYEKADLIGTNKDKITIILGKNNIQSGTFKKQNITAIAKINDLEIKNADLDFKYLKIGDEPTRYFEKLDQNISDYLDFLRRLAETKIVKRK